MIRIFILICSLYLTEVAATDLAFNYDALQSHNLYRAKHQVDPLQLSKRLMSLAQSYAEELAKISELDVNLGSKYRYKYQLLGINLYSFIDNTGSQVTDEWYSYGKNYNYTTLSSDAYTFTQIVWKNSALVGFGKKENPETGTFYYTALYYPPGNVPGMTELNVFKPNGHENNEWLQKFNSKETYDEFVERFQNETLIAINQYRLKHQVAPLKLDSDLSYTAHELAKELAQKATLDIELSRKYTYYNEPVGTTLYQSYLVRGYEAAAAWYEPAAKYKYKEVLNPMDFSTFTQMVWRNTTLVGISCELKRKTGLMYYVALYYPAGNVDGMYEMNVFKPQEQMKILDDTDDDSWK